MSAASPPAAADHPAPLRGEWREIARVPNGRLLVIPASRDTRGHGPTGFAKFYKGQLLELLRDAPQSTAGS